MSYVPIRINLSKAQQKKLVKGSSVRVTKSQIGNGPEVYLHPVNFKKINSSKNGTNLSLSPGEIIYTADKNNVNMGSGFFDDLWSGIKKVGSFLKDTGIATTLANAAQTAATPFIGSTASQIGRDILKQTTGIGFSKSDNMAKARAAKRGRISIMPSSGELTAGSFRIN